MLAQADLHVGQADGFAAVAVSRDDLVNTRSRSLSSRSMFSNDKTPATVTTSGGQFKPGAIQLGQKCVIL
jgi:hypothetical protein